MSQHSFAISNEAGAAFRGDVNSALQALASQSSGAAAPGTTYAYQPWVDTTTAQLKRRNAANSAWIARDTIDETFVISRSSNTIMGQSDRTKTFRCTSSFTQTFTAAATLADGWWAQFVNDNAAGAGVITMDPNGAETIDGATTIVLNPGESFIVTCNGASFFTVGRSSRYVAMPRSYLAGLGMSNNATITKLDVAAGKCRDSTDVADIIITAAITAGLIQTSGSWAAGSTQNKLDTGVRANSTWYHVHAIRKDSDGTGDWLFSLSLGGPTMPSGYTFFRRLGSVRTDGSGNITAFVQDGDYFRWSASVLDVNAVSNVGTSAVLRTLTVPTGLNVFAIGNVYFINGAAQDRVYISDPSASDEAPSASAAPLSTIALAASGAASEMVTTRTNTSAQVRTRQFVGDANQNFSWATLGWIDRRGRDN